LLPVTVTGETLLFAGPEGGDEDDFVEDDIVGVY